MFRPPLSTTETGKAWLSQFAPWDRPAAASLLDALMLMNDEQVATALRSLLADLAQRRSGLRKRKRVALYAEREIAEAAIFRVELVTDADGRLRRRAVGRQGPSAVKPIRGSTRVGSEGWVAFVISQAVKSSPGIFLNHPGPDRLRNLRQPVGALAMVSDFIGSGTRVRTMLDKFWAVPTVRSWFSRGWISFKVVAAVGTREGLEAVRNHRVRPEVLVQHVAPQLSEHGDRQPYHAWRTVIETYGPERVGGAGRAGFRDNAALIAFSYGIPNDTPLMLHAGEGWGPLFSGAAPLDLRSAFGLQSRAERVKLAAAATGIDLAPDLSLPHAEMVVFLRAIRGRWRTGAQTAVAETTGMTEPEVLAAWTRASEHGYLDPKGHLTDAGHAALGAAERGERKRPTVPTNSESYYPLQLRIPRGSSSISRPSGRPR
jgi:hypothetical protein